MVENTHFPWLEAGAEASFRNIPAFLLLILTEWTRVHCPKDNY